MKMQLECLENFPFKKNKSLNSVKKKLKNEKKLPIFWNWKIEKKKAIARRNFLFFILKNKKKSWVQYVCQSSRFKVSKEPQMFDNTIIYNQKKPLIQGFCNCHNGDNCENLFLFVFGGKKSFDHF